MSAARSGPGATRGDALGGVPGTAPGAASGASPGAAPASSIHLPCLAVGLLVMLGGTVYPLLFAHADGTANHGLALALFAAMSAGLVRGVGFVARATVWRLLFSGWTCAAALLLAAWLRWGA